jgi:hypothetical protein
MPSSSTRIELLTFAAALRTSTTAAKNPSMPTSPEIAKLPSAIPSSGQVRSTHE